MVGSEVVGYDGLNLVVRGHAEVGAPCDESPGHVGCAVRRWVPHVEFMVHELGHDCVVDYVAYWRPVHPLVEVSVVVGECSLALV